MESRVLSNELMEETLRTVPEKFIWDDLTEIQQRALMQDFHQKIGKELASNLNRNVLAEDERQSQKASTEVLRGIPKNFEWAKLTPEQQQALMEDFDQNIGQALADNLNRNVLAQDQKAAGK